MQKRHLYFAWVVVCAATIAAQLLSIAVARANPEQPFASIVLPSLLFLTLVTLPLSGVGIVLAHRLNLAEPPLISLLVKRQAGVRAIVGDGAFAFALGVVLGAVLLGIRWLSADYLPAELPALGHRGVIGGLAVSIGAAIAEEVWFRLGLMTLLIWCIGKLANQQQVTPVAVWTAMAISAVGFALLHIPQVLSYGANSSVAVVSTLLGNILVSVLYGWLYWRKGLFAAIVAHFSVDLMLHVLPAAIR